MALLTSGKSSKEIAAALGIRESTVGEHITRACAKLGVSDAGGLKGSLISVLTDLANRR